MLRGLLFLLLAMLTGFLCSTAIARQVELAYVSSEELMQLNQRFKGANRIGRSYMELISGKKWSCSLFGARTRLQKANNISLYKFEVLEKAFANHGAHVIKSYELKNGELSGVNHLVRETIRAIGEDSLISRIEKRNGPSTVLAYAECRSIKKL